MRFLKSRASSLVAMTLLAIAWTMVEANAGPREIDAAAYATMERLFYRVTGTRELANSAAGVLVFPSVVKAGFGFGGEYGEGALLVHGRNAGYYNNVSGSVGLQFGAQSRSVIIMFMTPEALDTFSRRNGWKVGVDGSVAVVNVGAGGAADTNTIRSPITAFIFGQRGLMWNLTLEGSKISRIYR